MNASQPAEWLETLSQREKEILLLIKDGMSNREIADSLHLSLETVKWYNQQVFTKLGVNSRTKAVASAIEHGLLPSLSASAQRVILPPPHNLPSQPTPFIWRDAELAQLIELLVSPEIRLVTIIGPGGIGKTRLALAAAELLFLRSSSLNPAGGNRFSDGIYFIPLTGIDRPDLVFPELARVLNYQFEKGRTQLRSPEQQLLDLMKPKQMLLVVDNFEQLVERSDLLADILRNAPEIKILATSRERLNLIEEHLFLLHGLAYPEREKSDISQVDEEGVSAFPAIKLFLQSARHLQPDFSIKIDDLAPVIQICQQVEGMPLALELAASWVDILPIGDIASEIEHSYGFMQTGIRNIQERHRSMRAVFDSTWQRLTLAEQDVFAQLSLFRGGFSREAAQRVTAPPASLGLLASLTNKSLILFNRKTGRFHIHELLRQYGVDKIALRPDKAAAFDKRFGDYFTSIAKSLGDELKGPRQVDAMAQIEADIQNIRLAWEWAISQGRWDLISRTIDALGVFYQRKGRFQEGEGLFAAAVAQMSPSEMVGSFSHLDEDQKLKSKVVAGMMVWHSNFYFILGQLSVSDQLLEKSLALLTQLAVSGMDIRREMAFARFRQGSSAMIAGERDLARQLCLESLEYFQACDDSWGSAMVLEKLCLIDWYLGDQKSARQWGEDSLRLRQRLGDLRGIADSYAELSAIVADELNLEEALDFSERAVSLYEQLDDREKIVDGIFNLGAKCMRIGDYIQGYSLQLKSYKLARDLNLRQIIPFLTCQLAYIMNHLGNYDETTQWANLCMPLARDMGDQRSIAAALYSMGLTALAKGQYLEAYQKISESAAMVRAMKDRRLLAMILAALGRAAFGAGIEAEVKPNLYEALKYSVEVHSSQAPLETFVHIAFFLSHSSDDWSRVRAIELFSLATRFPYVSNSRWLMDTAGTEIERRFSELPIDVIETHRTRGQLLDVWSTGATLQEELSTRGWIN